MREAEREGERIKVVLIFNWKVEMLLLCWSRLVSRAGHTERRCRWLIHREGKNWTLLTQARWVARRGWGGTQQFPILRRYCASCLSLTLSVDDWWCWWCGHDVTLLHFFPFFLLRLVSLPLSRSCIHHCPYRWRHMCHALSFAFLMMLVISFLPLYLSFSLSSVRSMVQTDESSIGTWVYCLFTRTLVTCTCVLFLTLSLSLSLCITLSRGINMAAQCLHLCGGRNNWKHEEKYHSYHKWLKVSRTLESALERERRWMSSSAMCSLLAFSLLMKTVTWGIEMASESVSTSSHWGADGEKNTYKLTGSTAKGYTMKRGERERATHEVTSNNGQV